MSTTVDAGDEKDVDMITASNEDATATRMTTTSSRPTRTQIRNRRKRYLDLHPEYFKSENLELAGPPSPLN